MLAGYPPFFDDNPFGIYEKILAGKIEWPRHLDPVAKDLIKKLLVQDRTKRLGNMKVRHVGISFINIYHSPCSFLYKYMALLCYEDGENYIIRSFIICTFT
jgi:serine/threonine protein kinase